MKLHLPWSELEKLLAEVITAKTAQPLYGKNTGKGLWLVGDEGVYLLANTTDGEVNSKRKKGDKPFVVYAKECDPTKLTFDEWWDAKRRSFGGDDSVEFVSLAALVNLRKDNPTHLAIEMTASKLALFTVKPKPQPKKKG